MKMTDTSISLMKMVAGLSVLVFLCGAVVLRDGEKILYFGVGILLGAALCFVRLRLMEKALDKSLDLKASDATLYARSQFLVRYVLTGVVLVGAALLSPISLYGAALGLLTLQVAAYIVSKKNGRM